MKALFVVLASIFVMSSCTSDRFGDFDEISRFGDFDEISRFGDFDELSGGN